MKQLLKSLPPIRGLVRERDELLYRVSALKHRLESYVDGAACYDHDGMRLFGKSTEFMQAERFTRAYQAGMNSGHKISRPRCTHDDIHIEWRVHLACWAASHALHLPGDFVECGVNTGIMSLAICNYLNFNATGKSFFLFDTYSGIPEDQMSEKERDDRVKENLSMYEECYALAKRNFAPFPRARLVRGKVPDTLTQVTIKAVSYLSLDMNIAAPELAAIEFFWGRLVAGAIVLLDDYGWVHHMEQKRAMDTFAERKGVAIATLPTGQGMLIKPP